MSSLNKSTCFAKALQIISLVTIISISPIPAIASESTYYTCEVKSTALVADEGKVKVTPDNSLSPLRIAKFVVQKETGDVHGELINIIGKPTKKILYERGGKGNFFRVMWQFEKPLAPAVLYLEIWDSQTPRAPYPYSLIGIANHQFITGLCK